MTTGGRNLTILGTMAVVIAVATTSVSLAVYHNSGDIYLDRSRPGFLPDEEEISEDEEEDYEFSKTGVITKEVLEDYIKNLEVEVKALDSYSDPFGAEALSDEKLGILEEM